MKFLYCILLTVFLGGNVLAQNVTAVVQGPDKADPGDLVILDASQSKGTAFRWVLAYPKDRTFLAFNDNKTVVFASGKPGEYLFVLVVAGVEKETLQVASAEKRVVIGNPTPGPGPTPNPGPNPPSPNPSPIPLAGLRVLVVSERTGTPIPSDQQAILTSALVRQALSRCEKGSNGVPEFRFFDPDVDLSDQPQHWKDAMKLPRASLPWVIISNGKTGFSGPLPKDVDSFLELLKGY